MPLTLGGETPSMTHQDAADRIIHILARIDREDSIELAERIMWFVLMKGIKPEYQEKKAGEMLERVIERLHRLRPVTD
jgi:hypothetical protein